MRLVGAHNRNTKGGESRSSRSSNSNNSSSNNNNINVSPLTPASTTHTPSALFRPPLPSSPTVEMASSVDSTPFDLSYGVANFHNLDKKEQREIMKQLIEREIVERVGGMSIGDKDGDIAASFAGGGEKEGDAGGHHDKITPGNNTFATLRNFSPRLSQFLSDEDPGGATGMTPKGEIMGETPVGGGKGGNLDKKILQEAVNAAARAVGQRGGRQEEEGREDGEDDGGIGSVMDMIMTPLGMMSGDVGDRNGDDNGVSDIAGNLDNSDDLDLDEYTRNLLMENL